MQSQIQISKSRNGTYKQRTSNICLLTYLCIYSERERERERERESNTFEVGRQHDNVFLNMIFQFEKLNKQFFYCSFTSV